MKKIFNEKKIKRGKFQELQKLIFNLKRVLSDYFNWLV